MPSRRAISRRMCGLRWPSCEPASVMSVLQAVYVPADDLTDPAPATTFAHLDATTVLSRGIAELGIYPAVDPLDSTSRMLDPRILGELLILARTGRAFCKKGFPASETVLTIHGL